MKLWKYKAVNEQGNIQFGLLNSWREDMAIHWLRSRNLYPLQLRPVVLDRFWLWTGVGRGSVYWTRMARQIGIMLEAGLPMLAIIKIIETKENNYLCQNQWHRVYNQVKDGYDLSIALAEFVPSPGLFLQTMVAAGEKSGMLAACLLEAADQMEEEYYFNRKIKGVLFYPCLLLVMALIILYILSIAVFPMYDGLFREMNVQLPLLTKGLICFGNVIPYLFPAMALLGLGVVLKNRDKVVWAIPGIQQIQKKKSLLQFCTILSKMISAGIPLWDAFGLLETIAKPQELVLLLEQLKRAVKKGQRIAPVLENSNFFPPDKAKMLGIAEESGRLGEMLNFLSQIFKRELEEKLEQYPRIIEQLLVLGMAGLVGLVAVGMLLPLFDLSTHLP
ncbi:MAG: type II secretion system F family protein [Peptococcaceae bacterium]|nr:type II secretion system F family protein [Peptococcaceae bacterium]